MHFIVSCDTVITKFKKQTLVSVKKAISGFFSVSAPARQDLDIVSRYLNLLLKF